MGYRKFKIKKEIWSLKGIYKIFNSDDEECYSVIGKAFSFWSQFTFRNSDGDEIFQIRRKVFSFKHTFYISKDGEDIYKIVKTYGFKPQIFIEDLINPDAFMVQGNLWGYEFKFYRDNKEFAVVSKDIWKLSDIYGVAVEEGYDEGIVLAIVVIINVMKDINESSS